MSEDDRWVIGLTIGVVIFTAVMLTSIFWDFRRCIEAKNFNAAGYETRVYDGQCYVKYQEQWQSCAKFYIDKSNLNIRIKGA